MAGVKNRRPKISTVLRWIKAGYGQGSKGAFKPFVFVRDVPSVGSSNMVQSRITGRNHHYLSWGEYAVHLLAEYSGSVVDIREQYALLPWEETQETAAKLGIRHPVFVGTSTPWVLTTDLLLSVKHADGVRLVAISIKPDGALDERDWQKLLLERLYWNRRGIQWILAYRSNIESPRTTNLLFFEQAVRTADAMRLGIDPDDFSRRFEAEWRPTDLYNDILARSSAAFSIAPNDGHQLLGMAVWRRKSRIDIDNTPLTHRSLVPLTQRVSAAA